MKRGIDPVLVHDIGQCLLFVHIFMTWVLRDPCCMMRTSSCKLVPHDAQTVRQPRRVVQQQRLALQKVAMCASASTGRMQGQFIAN